MTGMKFILTPFGLVVSKVLDEALACSPFCLERWAVFIWAGRAGFALSDYCVYI